MAGLINGVGPELSVLVYMFTPPQIAVVSTRKPNRRGLPLTGKNGDFSAITVTERSCAAPILKVERYISDRFLLVLGAA